jgi:hypothetical protein
LPRTLGHALAPAGSDTVSALAVSVGARIELQLDVASEGFFPGTDGHGTVPAGSVTISLPPGPVLRTSVPHIAPAEEGALPGTLRHELAADTARFKAAFADIAAFGESTAMHSATATGNGLRIYRNQVLEPDPQMNKALTP